MRRAICDLGYQYEQLFVFDRINYAVIARPHTIIVPIVDQLFITERARVIREGIDLLRFPPLQDRQSHQLFAGSRGYLNFVFHSGEA